MTDILPLWASALALLLIVLGTLLVVLLREGSTGRAAAREEADEDRLRSLFLVRRQELKQALQGEALSQAQQELDHQLIECLGEPENTPRKARWFSAGWTRIGVAAVLSFALPLAALAIYLQVGDPRAAIAAVQPPSAPHPVEGADVNGMVERLTQRLQQQPADLEGWMVLARSLEVMQRYDDAAQAYRRAIALATAPDQTWLRAKLNADLADSIGSAQSGALTGPAQEAIDAALALDPDQPKALALAGSAAAARGDLAQARQHWGRLLSVLEPGSEMAGRVSADLAALGTQTSNTAPNVTPQTQAPAKSNAVLSGTVRVAPAVASQVQPQDVVFLIIRDADQPGPPLGAIRLTAAQLPYTFAVDDSSAMMQTRLPSSFKHLTITARASRSHQPAAAKGDPTSEPVKANQGDQGLQLVIDRLTP